jgi:hypothetical protein
MPEASKASQQKTAEKNSGGQQQRRALGTHFCGGQRRRVAKTSGEKQRGEALGDRLFGGFAAFGARRALGPLRGPPARKMKKNFFIFRAAKAAKEGAMA